MGGKKKAKEQSKIWNDKVEPLKEGEELEYDGSAYQMLHRSKVEWPCLSIDWLVRDRCAFGGVHDQKSWFPDHVNGQLNPEHTVIDSRSKQQRHK